MTEEKTLIILEVPKEWGVEQDFWLAVVPFCEGKESKQFAEDVVTASKYAGGACRVFADFDLV